MTTNNTFFDINYMRGTDSQFNRLVKCSDECIEQLTSAQKLNFIDFIFQRSKQDKASLICNYKCVRELNYYNCKFKGRWIFMYILGFTEIFSSLCALSKLVINITYIKEIKKKLLYNTNNNILKNSNILNNTNNNILYNKNIYLYNSNIRNTIAIEYIIHFIAMSLAFFSSFLFHLHETIITRNMDYFTAIFSIAMNACVTTHRNIIILYYNIILKNNNILYNTNNINNNINNTNILYNTNNNIYNNNLFCIYILYFCIKYHIALFAFTSFFAYHVYRMAYVDFNYVYNMTACAVLILIIQANYFLTVYNYRDNRLKRRVVILTNLSIVSALFELSDFPPVFYLLDSHFLWHVGLLLSIKPFYKFTFYEAKLFRRKYLGKYIGNKERVKVINKK
ncbi:receptor protein-tyrosine kinase ERBB-2 precursor [Ecytonucleospora hepatopenaei]|uniref:Post-GPI attachment to proteins factor 3 n=1 Tax=Ecytonucleospora hepatopenaei TaxID=646526 RepID=A0A1W0E6Y6_9MICR|nr:receptor protein-tyrosine kinase ERBB-2 precursor [Ecytonucleospora hepatopenaei]